MTFTKYLRVNRSAPLFLLMWQAIFLALGVGLVLVINRFFNDESTYACMGSLFVLLATVVAVISRGNLTGSCRFNLFVGMGLTRREYLLYDPLMTALVGALGLAVSWCVYGAENWLYQSLYPGAVNEMDFYVLFQLKYVPLLVVGLVLLDLFLTALMLRFGYKTFVVVWIACCLSCSILPSAVSAYQEGGGSLFAKLGWLLLTVKTLLTPVLWLAVGIAVLLAALAAAVRVFQRAEVKL